MLASDWLMKHQFVTEGSKTYQSGILVLIFVLKSLDTFFAKDVAHYLQIFPFVQVLQNGTCILKVFSRHTQNKRLCVDDRVHAEYMCT